MILSNALAANDGEGVSHNSRVERAANKSVSSSANAFNAENNVSEVLQNPTLNKIISKLKNGTANIREKLQEKFQGGFFSKVVEGIKTFVQRFTIFHYFD